MKIAVVGAGAMGSLFGAMLAEAGNEVWLYDVWLEHVQAINENGLQIEREDETRTVKVKATIDLQQIRQAELVIIFVKASRTKAAAETAKVIAGSDGSVMTLQNGMGNVRRARAAVRPQRRGLARATGLDGEPAPRNQAAGLDRRRRDLERHRAAQRGLGLRQGRQG